MFLGYQGELLSLVADTREELENSSCITFDKIEETDEQVENVYGSYYIGEDNIIKAKQKHVRDYRNALLNKYVDPIISNILRWEEMSEYEKTCIKNYRTYLLDYTEKDNWWEELPITFDDFNYTDMVLVGREENNESGEE